MDFTCVLRIVKNSMHIYQKYGATSLFCPVSPFIIPCVLLCLCVVYVKYSSYCSACFGKFSCVVSCSGSGSCVVFCSEAP